MSLLPGGYGRVTGQPLVGVFEVLMPVARLCVLKFKILLV
jgi:hypothetical protein